MPVKPLRDDNPSFTLDAKARDCPPLQFVREFTVNSVEAIQARRLAGISNPGTDLVVWRPFHELGDRVPDPKLACIDTGISMTVEELELYINGISSSGKRQALDANYGMGAKIAGAVVSPAGITYLCWTGDVDSGATCTLLREDGRWGLAEDPEGRFLLNADPDLCPREIRDAGRRGTVVVFHGRAPRHDTTRPPRDDLGADWLLKAINTRFYDLPADVEVRCQRHSERISRRALGQRALLDPYTESRGDLRLSDATVEWRILDAGHERRKKDGGRFAATGHRAALYQGELYELRTSQAGGYRKLQEYGISFGFERVVLYVRPDRAQPDTVRARLVAETDEFFESKDLPWERWGDEFVQNMPEPIRSLIEQASSKAAARDRRDMFRRLEKLDEEMPIPRYRAAVGGPLTGGAFTHGGKGGLKPIGPPQSDPRPGPNPGTKRDGDLVTLFQRPGGAHVERIDSPRIPEIKPVWVSGDLDEILQDRAAQYLPRQAMVQLNLDFRGYTALLKFFRGLFGHLPGVDSVIVSEVQAACEDLVIDFIVGVFRLRCQPHWTSHSENHALDERALTGCLMQHATLADRIEKRLNARLRRAA